MVVSCTISWAIRHPRPLPPPAPAGRPPPALVQQGLNERDLRGLSRELKGVRVVVDRPGGKPIRKTIWGLSKVGARTAGVGDGVEGWTSRSSPPLPGQMINGAHCG